MSRQVVAQKTTEMLKTAGPDEDDPSQ